LDERAVAEKPKHKDWGTNKFCPDCGERLRGDDGVPDFSDEECPGCEARLVKGAKHCSNCGASVEENEDEDEDGFEI